MHAYNHTGRHCIECNLQEYDAQSSHNNGAQPVRTEQQISGEPLENDKEQESDKQNSESLGNTEKQRINEEQGDDKYLENDEHWQTGQLQKNEEQQINIGQQHSSDNQEVSAYVLTLLQ